jgi:hypothetical protein
MNFIDRVGLYHRLPHDNRRTEENGMTGHLAYDTNQTGPAIRRATEADRDALERLAALDSAPTPSGAVLIAEVGDEPQAAIEITGGTVVADPFRSTAHVVEMLRARAIRLSEPAGSSRRLRLRWRSAYRAA